MLLKLPKRSAAGVAFEIHVWMQKPGALSTARLQPSTLNHWQPGSRSSVLESLTDATSFSIRVAIPCVACVSCFRFSPSFSLFSVTGCRSILMHREGENRGSRPRERQRERHAIAFVLVTDPINCIWCHALCIFFSMPPLQHQDKSTNILKSAELEDLFI